MIPSPLDRWVDGSSHRVCLRLRVLALPERDGQSLGGGPTGNPPRLALDLVRLQAGY